MWALSPRLSWPRPLCRRPEAAAPWPAGPPSLPELAGEGAQAGPAPGPSEGTYRELHRFSNVAPSSVATAVLERWDILPALGPRGSALCEGGRATVSASRRRPRPPPSLLGGRAGPGQHDTQGRRRSSGQTLARHPPSLLPVPRAGNQIEALAGRKLSLAGPAGVPRTAGASQSHRL